jgi:hypothetical protein
LIGGVQGSENDRLYLWTQMLRITFWEKTTIEIVDIKAIEKYD